MLDKVALTFFVKIILQPLIFIAVTLFGIGYVLPKTWIHLERAVWRLLFGSSVASEWLIDYALRDFHFSIQEIEADENVQRTLAILLAIWRRAKAFPSLYAELKRMQEGRVEDMFVNAIEDLNEGWRSGTPARLLDRYIDIIETLASHPNISKSERIRGLSSVAMVRYALGDLKGGNRLAKKNSRESDSLDPAEKLIAKWVSGYALNNSTLFLGYFEKAMDSMARQWSNHYAQLDRRQKRLLRAELSGLIPLNPILALPRHIILASAFNDGLADRLEDPTFWPNQKAYDASHEVADCVERELHLVEAWYEEAKSICGDEVLSLNFSHAYFAFALTLLLLAPGLKETLLTCLHEKIKQAFDSIKEPAPIASQYVKHGFSGIYYLTCERNHEALTSFRLAAVSSSISGNSFAECLFAGFHGVAAQRLNPYVKTEVDFYLKEAKKLADTIGGDFYPRFCARAFAAVSMLRGEHGKAQRYLLRSRQGRKGERIMRILQPDLEQPSRLSPIGCPSLIGRL